MNTRTLRPFFVIGTRPEAIKLAPVVRVCRSRAAEYDSIVCLTGQHRELLDDMIRYFAIEAEFDLDVMRPRQSLPNLTARLLVGIDQAVQEVEPDCVVAQGDTSTAMVAALAAFYRGIPFVHVEAGLRTGNIRLPWPEEMHRRLISLVTAIHCAPSSRAAANLIDEGASHDSVFVTGNTVIDALHWTLAREQREGTPWPAKYASYGDRRVVLITGHRRENHGSGMTCICEAVKRLAELLPHVEFIYPVHPNPAVMQSASQLLRGIANVRLTEPAPYPEFIWLMNRAALIISDSGGVQEEAAALGRFVLVTRESTERSEVIQAGAAELVGTDTNRIVTRALEWLTRPDAALPTTHPYGVGHAAEHIADLMLEHVPRTRIVAQCYPDASAFGLPKSSHKQHVDRVMLPVSD